MAVTTLPKAEIVKRYHAGESVGALASSFGRSTSTMGENLRRWGAEMRSTAGFKSKRYSSCEKQYWVDRYAAGETIESLATAAGISWGTMKDALHRWGATMRRSGPTRLYRLDESFFERIDTEEKAYWLGFAFADGSVIANCRVFRTELHRRDVQHLRKLATALQTDIPIKPFPAHSSYYLAVGSAKLCRFLSRHGCVPNKTCRHGTPKIAKKLLRHFYRGVVDGDGSLFCSTKSKAWAFDCVGSRVFIEDFQAWLMRRLGLSATKLRCRGEAWSVRYDGTRQVAQIGRLLYANATVFLDRKNAKYLQLRVQAPNPVGVFQSRK